MSTPKQLFRRYSERCVSFGRTIGQRLSRFTAQPRGPVIVPGRYIPQESHNSKRTGITITNGGVARGNDKSSSKNPNTSGHEDQGFGQISEAISFSFGYQEMPFAENLAPPSHHESQEDITDALSDEGNEDEMYTQHEEGDLRNTTSLPVLTTIDDRREQLRQLKNNRLPSDKEREADYQRLKTGPKKVTHVPKTTPSGSTDPLQRIAECMDGINRLNERMLDVLDQRHSSSAPKREKLRVPKFEGDKGKAVDWLDEYERVCQINGWDAEYGFELVPTVLEGRAKVWYRTIEYDIREWRDFVDEFHRRYIPADSNHNKFVEFSSAIQLPHESASDYIDRVLELKAKSKLQIPEQTVITVIKKGLKNATYRMAVSREVRLSSVLDMVRDFDDANENTSQDNKWKTERSQSFQQRSRNDREREGWTRAAYRPEPQRFDQRRDQRSDQRYDRRPEQRQDQRPRYDQRADQRYGERRDHRPEQRFPNSLQNQQRFQRRPASGFQSECYNCGKVGHSYLYCFAPRNQERIDAKIAEIRNLRERANQGEPPARATTQSLECDQVNTTPKEVDTSLPKK